VSPANGKLLAMTNYECKCTACEQVQQIRFNSTPYPEYGDLFPFHCSNCGFQTQFTRTLTRKTQAEIKRKQAEEDLRNALIERCDFFGFQYRFLYQSIIVTTKLSDWCFDYHQAKITLYHESTNKINFKTGDFAKAHVQFRNRSISPVAVIDYIASHDQWRAQQNDSGK
jgi:hypothetical protein